MTEAVDQRPTFDHPKPESSDNNCDSQGDKRIANSKERAEAMGDGERHKEVSGLAFSASGVGSQVSGRRMPYYSTYLVAHEYRAKTILPNVNGPDKFWLCPLRQLTPDTRHPKPISFFLPAYAVFRVFEDDATFRQCVANFVRSRKVATVARLLTFVDESLDFFIE